MSDKSTRRDFLRRSAAIATGAVVLPQIIPSTALGMGGKLPPSDRIVMGAIGTGDQGTCNLEDFLKRVKDLQFVAVKKNNIVWQTGSWQRSQENFRRGAELVINGRIGKIIRVDVGLPDGNRGCGTPPAQEVPAGLNWEMWLGPSPKVSYRGVCHFNWRWILDYSGGQLTDWAGHHIDIAQWGIGMERSGPVEIYGEGIYPREGLYDVPVEYDFICKYVTGIEMRVANHSRLPFRKGVVWYGDRGWINVDRGRLDASDPKILKEVIGENEIHLYKSDNHIGNFLECIKSRKETVAPVEIAHRSITAGLLGEIAMTTGQKINWDPVKEEIIGNPMASRLLSRPYREPWKSPTI